MREINLIVVHCTATPATKADGTVREVTKEDLYQWHVVENGWDHVGYHCLIQRSGRTVYTLPTEVVGNHAKGYNTNSIGIALAGGVDAAGLPENNFTADQWKSLEKLLKELHMLYPKAYIKGHNELSRKDCPSFDVQEYLKKIGL